jgi:hypothetical protein
MEWSIGGPPLKIVSGDPKLPTKMATKLKIEKRGMKFFLNLLL